MKNIGISLIVFLTSIINGVQGQTNPKLNKIRFVTLAEKLRKAAKLEKEAEGKPLPSNPVFSNRGGASVHSTTAVTTFSDLGQSRNPFTILGAGRNVISVVPSLNTVAFFRRGGIDDAGGLSGNAGNKVFYDLNTKGGADGQWQISRGPVFDDDAYINDPTHISQGGPNIFGSRYPQGALYNPAGNSDTANVVAIGNTRVLDGTNDAWGGLGIGWQKLAAGSAAKQFLESSADPLHFRQESMEVTTNAVFVTEPIEDLSSGSVAFTDKIAVYKFTYNSFTNDIEKTNIFIPFSNEGGDYATSISNTAIAFGPDGQVGFLVVSAANNEFDSIATYIPYMSKTTDGGQTWSDLVPVKINKKKSDGPNTGLDSFRDKMLSNLVYFDANGNLIPATYADAATKSVHYVDYLVNDLDLVVDKNNYAHLFASITVSGFGDTLNATFPGGITYYPGYRSWNMHMFFNDPQGLIKGELINQNVGLNGCWGDCAGSDNFSDANRPQLSRSQDGSIIGFAWYDTDTTSHPQLTDDNNSNPDLWLQRVRVGTAGQFFYGPQTRNITKNSDNDGLAALGNVAPRLLNGANGNYQLASTIATFADYDPAATIAGMLTQHLYVGNVNIPVAVDSFPVQVVGDVLNAQNTTLATINTSNVTSILANSAVCGGDVSSIGSSAVIARGVCWSTTPEPTVALTTKTVNGSGLGTFTSNLTGLLQGTTYYVRAYATNSSGTAYGNELQFTTLSPTTIPTLTTTTVSGITQTSGTGGGNVSNDGGAAVTARGVCWSTSTNPTISLSTKTVNGTGSGIFTSNLTGLSAGTIYYVRAYATNSVGTAYGNELQFSTLSAAALATLSTTTITNINQTTASGGGNIINDGGAAVTARGVCWSTSTNPTISLSTKTVDGTGSGIFTSSLIGLSAGTTYYVRAYATNSVGTAYGTQVSFTTTGNTQGVTIIYKVDITNYLASGAVLGANGIRVGGNFADQSASVAGGNMVNWSPSDANSAMVDLGNNIWSITVTYPPSSVGATQTYKFVNNDWGTNEGTDPLNTIATGGCGVDDGAGNINRTFVIPASNQTICYLWDACTACSASPQVPVVTTSSPATSITSNSATVGGSATGTGITSKGICYSTSQNPSIAGPVVSSGTGSGSFSSDLSGLQSATLYYARAYATNSAGTAYGNQISFTTSAALVLPTISTSAISGQTQTTANGGGNVGADGGAVVTSRGVCWSTSPNPNVSLSTKTIDGSGTGTFTSSMAGLSPSTVYYVRAYATNSIGTAYGTELTFLTLSQPNLATISTNAVSGITSFEALAGGQISADGGTTVTVRGVCWSTAPSPTISLSTKTSDGQGTGSFASLVSGLNPNTTYYLRAYATNSAGTSYGNERSFTTLSCDFLSQISGGNQTLTCLNPTANLSVTGSTSLVWSNGASGSSISVSPNTTTNYYVVGSQDGCIDTSFVTITVNKTTPPTPQLTVQGASQICPGQVANLFSSASENNQWYQNSNPIQGATNQTYAASQSGSYFVRVTDPSNGCFSESSTQTIGLLAGPVITQQPTSQTIADGQQAGFSIALQEPTGATYQWQTNLGTGFQNLSDVLIYSGTSTSNLNLSSVSSLNNNQPFRCIVGSGSCLDTSATAILSISTSVSGSLSAKQIVAIPNPSNGKVHFAGLNGTGELILTNILGSEVWRQNIKQDEILDVSHLPVSAYFYTIKTQNGMFKGKLVLQ